MSAKRSDNVVVLEAREVASGDNRGGQHYYY